MKQLVLVSFDIDYVNAKPEAYRKAYEVLEQFGMKRVASNHLGDVALPTTTVYGPVELREGATISGARDQLLAEMQRANVPITHIIVAFVDGVAGLGEPVPR